MDYQSAMGIDRNNLDEETIQLPGWFGYVVEQEAQAAEELAALTDKMKVLQAEIDLMIRSWDIPRINLTFGLSITNLTEATYKNLCLIHPKVIELQNRIIEARHRKSLYFAATRSMEKKGEMLKELSKLYAQGYYMRIEGQEYKMPKIDLMIKQLQAQLIERENKENLSRLPSDDAQAKLQAKIDQQNNSAKESISKVKKTPKTTSKGDQKAPKRVKG